MSSRASIIDGMRVIRFPVFATLGQGLVWPSIFVHLYLNHYDIVHVHSYNHPHVLLSLLGGRLSRSKLILTPHNPFAYPVRSTWEAFVSKAFDKFLGPIVLRGFDAIVCATPAEFQRWHERGVPNARLKLIPPAIENKYFQTRPTDEARLRLGIPLDALVVLFVGRMHWQKGIVYLLRAFAVIASTFPKSILLLFGEQTAYSKEILDNLLIPQDVKKRILVLHDQDAIDESDNENLKLDAYAACDFLALPSLGEGYGLVLLEAMAGGKPVIASRVGGIPHIVKDGTNGILIMPNNVESLVDAICLLGENAQLRGLLGINGLATAREHTFTSYVDKLEAVYVTGGGQERSRFD